MATGLIVGWSATEGDKYARAASVTPALGDGEFRLLEGESWRDEYLAEMTAFPGGAHDDFVDATVQALIFLRKPREPGIIEFFRKKAIAMANGSTYPPATRWLCASYSASLAARNCFAGKDLRRRAGKGPPVSADCATPAR